MKKIWNNLIVAFAMYSKIPMPMADWTPENMKYVMCFFPWIGLVIGGLDYAWYALCRAAGFGAGFVAMGLVLVPFFVTGGIHYDGFLDTMDALSSWQERERRLQILKDPHAGAFAIICGCVYFVTFFGAATEVDQQVLMAYVTCFFVSRCFSGLSVVLFPNANPKGSAAAFRSGADKRNSVLFLVAELILVVILGAVFLSPLVILVGISSLLVWIYYYYKSSKYFGGITGDLAGYFLSLCELVALIVLIFGERLMVWIL